VREFDQSGAIISEHEVALPFAVRQDVPLGHPRGQRTGLYEIESLNGVSYGSYLARYHAELPGQFTFGYALQHRPTTCEGTLPASTMGNALSWIEVANPSASTQQVKLTMRDQGGVIRG